MKGFTLIEVIFALALFSMVLLFVSTLQVQSKKLLMQAYFKQIAVQEALSLENRFIANKEIAYRLREKRDWEQCLASLLPSGKSRIITQGHNHVVFACWKWGGRQCISYRMSE
jgi:prepilin-type N-terminal cleavage/methylation domain-containing protein